MLANETRTDTYCKLMVSIWVSSAFKKPSRAVARCRTARTLHPRLLTRTYGLGALELKKKRDRQKKKRFRNRLTGHELRLESLERSRVRNRNGHL
jgi:hypothetical protein